MRLATVLPLMGGGRTRWSARSLLVARSLSQLCAAQRTNTELKGAYLLRATELCTLVRSGSSAFLMNGAALHLRVLCHSCWTWAMLPTATDWRRPCPAGRSLSYSPHSYSYNPQLQPTQLHVCLHEPHVCSLHVPGSSSHCLNSISN